VEHHAPLYIVITSDKGLAGALNSGVLRAVLKDMQASGLPVKGTVVVPIGRKARDFFAARGCEIEDYRANDGEVSSEMLQAMLGKAAARFIAGEVGGVRVAYQNFVSTFEQHPTIRTLFPLSLEELRKVVADITPKSGLYSKHEAAELTRVSVYNVEPSPEEVLEVVIPKLAGVFLYHALLQSQASEHSARMVAMKSAGDKAEELSHALTLQFNKARQAAITREVSEIVGGMEAVAG
jgi:F-type H+-transporting ATPase subunit gamma